MNLLMERFCYCPDGTFGYLNINGQQFYTVEQPWNGNAVGHSCIPEGVYTLRQRESQIITETTHGDWVRGWEVTDVRGRSLIMIHIANWPWDVKGCIGIGADYRIMLDRRNNKYGNGVSNSRVSFKQLMDLLSGEEEHQLEIRQMQVEYP